MKNKRTISQAMESAAQLKRELPKLIQPSRADHDRVVLFDHVNRLNRRIEQMKRKCEAAGA